MSEYFPGIYHQMKKIIRLLLLFCVVNLIPCCCQQHPVKLIVIHRHGIREIGKYDPETKQATWRAVQLLPYGEEQLKRLGQWVREKYDALLPKAYDSNVIQSFVTPFSRTAQSAVGFLKGLFDSTVRVYLRPVDDHLKMALMSPWIPSTILSDRARKNKLGVAQMLFPTFTQQERQLLDDVLGSAQLCQQLESFSDCISIASDVTQTSMTLPGSSPLDPRLGGIDSDLMTRVIQFRRTFSFFSHAVDVDPDFTLKYLPSRGWFLADFILRVMQEKVVKGAKVVHLSAHDDTLVALYHALGVLTESNKDSDLAMPNFAEAVVFEILDDGSFIVKRLLAPLSSSPDEKYTAIDLSIRCVIGESMSTSCKIDNWQNTVQSISPPEPNGCFLPPEDHEASGCTAAINKHGNTTQMQKPNDRCLHYRRSCPQYGCAANEKSTQFVVDFGDPAALPCVPIVVDDAASTNLQKSSENKRHKCATIVLSITNVILIGVVLTLSITTLTQRHKKQNALRYAALH